jgi:hypothetical protein
MKESTPENAARSWRCLSDQLTAEQIDTLTCYERESSARPELLATARSYADCNLVSAVIGNVAAPAGALSVDEWSDALTPDAFRLFWGATRAVKLEDGTGIAVVIRGSQSTDGSVEEHGILIEGGSDEPMTTGDVRRLAAALLEAADEIDRSAAR